MKYRVVLMPVFFATLLSAGRVKGPCLPEGGKDAIILPPCEDVYIQSYGGGEGWNVFLKFDISSVPKDKTIDSVYLKVYVWSVNGGWDGDVNFWNVHNQTWVESDSAQKIWSSTTSDSMTHYAGFGLQVGWAKSITLKRIFLKDYNAHNSYCTIKMKDSDDITHVPPSEPFPIDSQDTLGLGAWWPLGHYICLYPHERGDSMPKLFIYSNEFGAEEEIRPQVHQKDTLLTIRNSPNPFRVNTVIEFRVESSELKDLQLQIYDLAGQIIRAFPISTPQSPITRVVWDGTDESGSKVGSGIYFYKIGRAIGKISLIK